MARLHEAGHPLRHYAIQKLAEELIFQSSTNDASTSSKIINKVWIGSSWVQRFLHRCPDLKSKYTPSIENGRLEVQQDEGLNQKTYL